MPSTSDRGRQERILAVALEAFGRYGFRRASMDEIARSADISRQGLYLQVVALVGHGLGNDEIAERLVVSRATARTHVSRAMVKLDAHDRAKLVVFAYESGLVRPRTRTAMPPARRVAIA
jgi:DNA-binding NarL/FixJ family response regulator